MGVEPPELLLCEQLVQVKCKALVWLVILVPICPLMLNVLEDRDACGQELDNFDEHLAREVHSILELGLDIRACL